MAMTFHSTILQYDGKIVGRSKHRSAELRSNPTLARLMLGYRMMLDELLPVPFDSGAKFQQPLTQDERIILHWRQPHECMAMAMFEASKKVGAVAAYLTGTITEVDEIAVAGFEGLLADTIALAGHKYRPQLSAIPERPVVVLVRLAASDKDANIIGNMAVGLAASLFEKMADTERGHDDSVN